MEEILDIGSKHKCAYEYCDCVISSLETYCSEYCADAELEKVVEVQCDCKHVACALTDD
jgi:hypothetical protein